MPYDLTQLPGAQYDIGSAGLPYWSDPRGTAGIAGGLISLPHIYNQPTSTPTAHGSYNYTQPSPNLGLNWGNGYQGLTFGSQPVYQGGLNMPGPQVGGYIYAPGYGQAQARLAQQQYANAYEQARQANIRRYNEIGGFNDPGLGLQTRRATDPRTGKPIAQVNLNGTWVDTMKADPAAMNAEIAQASQFAPMLGGYYGRYARGMTDVNDLSSVTDFLQGRQGTAMGLIGGMNNVAGQYNTRTQTGQDLLGGLYPVAQQYGQRTATGMGITDQLSGLIPQYNQRTQTALNMAGNLGLQSRNDINRQYDNLVHGETADLAARGLGNSTVASSVRQAAEADRAQALGRLNDQIRQQQLGVYSDLSGQALNAAMQVPQIQAQNYANLSGQQLQFAGQIPQLLAQNYAQLSGQALDYAGRIPQMQTQTYLDTSGATADWLQRMGQLKLNTDVGLSGDMLKFAEGISEPYPNPSLYQNAAQSGMNFDAQRALLARLQQFYGSGGGYYG